MVMFQPTFSAEIVSQYSVIYVNRLVMIVDAGSVEPLLRHPLHLVLSSFVLLMSSLTMVLAHSV